LQRATVAKATIHDLRDRHHIAAMSCAKRQLHCSERPPRTQRSAIFAISRAPSHRSNELREASAPLQQATRNDSRSSRSRGAVTVADVTIHDLRDLAITSSWMQRFTIFSISRPIMSLQ